MTFMSFIGPLLLAGLLHMEESYCMLYMPVYLVTIPSMYILLVIYSLFNLWNTGNSNFLHNIFCALFGFDSLYDNKDGAQERRKLRTRLKRKRRRTRKLLLNWTKIRRLVS